MRPTTLITLLLLGGIAAHRYVTVRKPAGVDEYHQRVRDAAARIPKRIGSWVGEDVPVPARAIKVLDPNAIISRRYVNVESGLTAGVLFVHCADAHDMVGHFPLRCYPTQGWTCRAQAPRDWAAGEFELTGTEYEFHMPDAAATGGADDRAFVIANGLFRPGGRVLRDMNAMSRSIVGAGGQAAGAGQLQIRFAAGVPRDVRDAAITELLAGLTPAVRAIIDDGPR